MTILTILAIANLNGPKDFSNTLVCSISLQVLNMSKRVRADKRGGGEIKIMPVYRQTTVKSQNACRRRNTGTSAV